MSAAFSRNPAEVFWFLRCAVCGQGCKAYTHADGTPICQWPPQRPTETTRSSGGDSA